MTVAKPNTYTSGTTILSSAVNANFDALFTTLGLAEYDSQHNANGTHKAITGTSVTVTGNIVTSGGNLSVDGTSTLTGNVSMAGTLDVTGQSTIPNITGVTTISTASADVIVSASQYSMPVGGLVPYAGTTAPTGFLLCNGAAVSRTTYSDLFSVLGTAYGSGDGSTTFNLPDLQGKFLRGLGGDAASRGTTQADSTAVNGLSVDTHSNHTHSIDHNHASFASGGAGQHNHQWYDWDGGTNNNDRALELTDSGAPEGATYNSSGSKVNFSSDTGLFSDAWTNGPNNIASGDTHTHSVDVPAFSGNSGNPSTSLTHSISGDSETRPINMAFHYIIKY